MKPIPIPPMVIEDPPHLLFWEADEFLPSVVIFAVLFMWDMTVLAFILPVVFVKIMSRVKTSNMRGFLFHWFWRKSVFSMNDNFLNGGVDRLVD